MNGGKCPMDGAEVLALGPGTHGVGDHFRHLTGALNDRLASVTVIPVDDATYSFLDALRMVWRARRKMRRVDIVHIEFGSNDRTLFWLALLATCLTGRVVLILHDYPAVAKSPAVGLLGESTRFTSMIGYRMIAPMLDSLLVRLLLRRAGGIGVLSSEARDRLAELAKGPVGVVPHGAPPLNGQNHPPSQSSYVLYAGFLGYRKGVDVLLMAWELLSAPPQDLSLVIAADHEAVDYPELHVRRDSADRWTEPPRWIGFLPDEAQLQKTIAQAAVVVLPYRSSSPASGILARAMLEGRAVVATDVPAAVAAIRDGVDGLLVPADDPTSLAKALGRVISDPELRDQIGASARERAEQLFSTDNQLAALFRLYGSVRVGGVFDGGPSPVDLGATT